MRSRTLLALPVVLGLVLLRAPAFTGEVNLTRLTVTTTATQQPIDASELEKLCADPEGCEVVMAFLFPINATTKSGRLFMLANGAWFSSITIGIMVDNNGQSPQPVLSVFDVLGELSCFIVDADSGGVDTTEGFTLINTAANNGGTCVATFVD